MTAYTKDFHLRGVDLRTDKKITWCPGCPNHIILESSRRAFMNLIKKGLRKEDLVVVTGVGCHGKMYDYFDVSGMYCLHGRAIPTATGIKIGNPNLEPVVFAGDGDTYSEGMQHFISACRFNPDITLLVHDNQAFSLTTGQATPTSQQGYTSKAEPLGEFNVPLNPIHLALSAGASFVARCNARDIAHTQEIIEAAVTHVGFAFVEIIQDCIIFNLEANNKDDVMYKMSSKNRSMKEALTLAQEYDYNTKKGKIPLGIFYSKRRKTLHEEWPQLMKLKKIKKGWKQMRK